jgi:hypothetical protein
MLTLPAAVRIYVAAEPVDLRRGFDGLAAAARSVIGADPLSGHLFVFLNRRKNRIKLLVWDRTGFLLLYWRTGGTRLASTNCCPTSGCGTTAAMSLLHQPRISPSQSPPDQPPRTRPIHRGSCFASAAPSASPRYHGVTGRLPSVRQMGAGLFPASLHLWWWTPGPATGWSSPLHRQWSRSRGPFHPFVRRDG